MQYSLALVAAFAAVSLAGPIEMNQAKANYDMGPAAQSPAAEDIWAAADELCKNAKILSISEDKCKNEVKECVDRVRQKNNMAQNYTGQLMACMEEKYTDSRSSAPAATKELPKRGANADNASPCQGVSGEAGWAMRGICNQVGTGEQENDDATPY